jgi:hypothetical protein
LISSLTAGLFGLLIVYLGGWFFGFWTGNFSLLLFVLTVVTLAYWVAERLVVLPRRRQEAQAAVAAWEKDQQARGGELNIAAHIHRRFGTTGHGGDQVPRIGLGEGHGQFRRGVGRCPLQQARGGGLQTQVHATPLHQQRFAALAAQAVHGRGFLAQHMVEQQDAAVL